LYFGQKMKKKMKFRDIPSEGAEGARLEGEPFRKGRILLRASPNERGVNSIPGIPVFLSVG